MKYSEYLQLREILQENNVKWEDFKKDPQLYEGILSNFGQGLWNLTKKGMKAVVSKGLSSAKREKLNTIAEEIRTWILREVEEAKNKDKHVLHKILTKKDEYKKELKQNPDNTEAQRIIRNLDRQIASYIRKKVDNKVKAMQKKIDKNKNITDKDKDLLGDYWDNLSIDLEVTIAEALEDAGIIEDSNADTFLQDLGTVKRFRKTQREYEEQPEEKEQNINNKEQPEEKDEFEERKEKADKDLEERKRKADKDLEKRKRKADKEKKEKEQSPNLYSATPKGDEEKSLIGYAKSKGVTQKDKKKSFWKRASPYVAPEEY
jgi:uncharacterized protein (DUF1697 family)